MADKYESLLRMTADFLRFTNDSSSVSDSKDLHPLNKELTLEELDHIAAARMTPCAHFTDINKNSGIKK